jgi:RimJ/RimL family protein N-acetyltransferase
VQHDISLSCARYRLRPVTLEDAAFIVELRTDPRLSRYVHEISPRIEDQIAWLESYFDRAGDYYFIVEGTNSSELHGTIGLYNITSESDCPEWGRWILKRGSMASLESAWLIYEVAFSRLRLAELCSRTLVENQPVLSFHDTFGASRAAVLEEHFVVRGERKAAIEHRVTAAEWPMLSARHYSTVTRLASRVPSHWRRLPA